MKIGFLYAGQGSQYVGMGKEFYDEFDSYQSLINNAPTSFNLAQASFEGSEENLSQTHIAQPAMIAMEAGITQILAEKDIVPFAATGLSLGEYGALIASGTLKANKAICICEQRGHAMTRASENIDSAMFAIIGLDPEAIEELCNEESAAASAENPNELVAIANLNCPGQTVISGTRCATCAVAKRVQETGKRAIELNVSGPFHTAIMKPAGDELAKIFASESFKRPKIPVAFNTTGEMLTTQQDIAKLLEAQVQSTVKFESCLRAMIEAGVEVFFEIGPGNVLAGFMKRIDRKIPVYPISTPEEMHAAINAINALSAKSAISE